MDKGNAKQNLLGRRFGKLTVISSAGRLWKKYYWNCICDCGIEKKIRGTHLTHGKIISCGCSKRERRCVLTKQTEGILGLYTPIYRYYWHSAKRRGLEFNLPLEFFLQQIQARCFYCGDNPNNKCKQTNVFYSGLDRINNNKGYILDNIVPCCITCNIMKRNMDQIQFLSQVKKIYRSSQCQCSSM